MHQVSKQAANQFTTFCRKLGIWGLGGLTVNKNSGSGFEFFSERILGFQEFRDAKEFIRDTPSTHAFLRSNEYIQV
jgi:hypothetical protein